MVSSPQFQSEGDKCTDEEVVRWWELARDFISLNAVLLP